MTGGFTLPEYANSDDFFSPLTSPAIEAQATHNSTRTTASPIETNDLNSKPGAAARRGRRRGSMSTRSAAKNVKQSPATKPVRRRKGVSVNNLSSEKIDAALQRSGFQSLQPPTVRTAARSSDDSVSPEPLSEALMGPPPVPQGAAKSPGTVQMQSSGSNDPVTPATLMMIPRSKRASPRSAKLQQQPGIAAEPMEEIRLPDAAAPAVRPTGLHIDVSRQSEDDQSTPTLSAKSAKLSATSTPRSGFARTTTQDSLGKSPKVDGREGGRGNKKRQSTSSAAISPALRPKISPSITPLAPAAGE
jgi:hypothetical protein